MNWVILTPAGVKRKFGFWITYDCCSLLYHLLLITSGFGRWVLMMFWECPLVMFVVCKNSLCLEALELILYYVFFIGICIGVFWHCALVWQFSGQCPRKSCHHFVLKLWYIQLIACWLDTSWEGIMKNFVMHYVRFYLECHSWLDPTWVCLCIFACMFV